MQRTPDNIGPSIQSPSTAGLTSVPLFHAAWLFAAGIAFAHFCWLRPTSLLIALFPVAVLCCVAAFRAQRILWIPMATLWCLLGAWCAEMEPQPAPAPVLSALSDGLLRTVEGTIVDAAPMRSAVEQDDNEPSADGPTQRIDLHVTSIEVVTDELDEQTAVDGGVRLTIRWPQTAPGQPVPQDYRCGDHIRAVARLLPPANYRDPGAWSRTNYLLDQGITSTASVAIERVESLQAVTGVSLDCRVSGWQHAASARLLALPAAIRGFPDQLRLGDDDAIMLAAMVTGDRTYLNHSIRVGFERTGSFHMLVVSGFHLAIVAGCLFWIARRLRLPNVPATLITIFASFAYALFTGFATPVQRSLWMVTLYLLGRLIYRERNPLNTIGFASLCLLAISPRSLFESSLQMTLLAVISIGGIAVPLLQNTIHPYLAAARDLPLIAIDIKLAPRLAQFRVTLRMIASSLERATSRMVGRHLFPWTIRAMLRAIEVLVVSCVVELAMALPMAIYFHRITVFALPVNIFILPLLIVLMPAALLTLGLQMTWPAAAIVPAMVVAIFLHIGVGLVHMFGSLSWGDFRVATPMAWQSATFVALLSASILLAHNANTSRRRWQRHGAWVALFLAAFAAVAPRPIQHPQDAMLVEAIDVGQGDSLLVITPEGKTLLVDGGGIGGKARQATQEFDVGEEVVSPTLWARGIRHLDVVALSHAHSDHMGGLPAVLRNFKPSELWVGNNPPIAAYKALLDEATALHVRIRPLRAGDSISLASSQIHVLAPSRDYQPGMEPANNDSLVLHVAYGGTSVMLEGDAEESIEQAMLSEAGLQSNLLKVGHHGSVSSTRPDFLARVAPQWAIISCGQHNPYGHPREEVLHDLEAAKVRTYSTDINGATCFQLNGKTAEVNPFCGR